MAKAPRPSINDQLAAIAAQGASNVTTFPRGNVETGNGQRDNATPDHVAPVPAARLSPDAEVPDGFKRRVRVEKPHASVYAHPKVFKAIREIAAAQGCKPHDIYLEGLRLALRAHGRDFDALNRGE